MERRVGALPSSPEHPAFEAEPGGFVAATDWAAILDEFERQLAVVDLLSADLDAGGMTLPLSDLAELVAEPGPVPDAMIDRATSVLAAQRDALGRLERLRSELSRHLGVARALDERPDVAVYLDRSA